AVAIDVRGYGRSSRPADPAAYRMTELVADCVAPWGPFPHPPGTLRTPPLTLRTTPPLTTRYAGERHPEPLVEFSLSARETPRNDRHLVRVAEWQTR
ncbi:hypothetical protein ACWEP3_03320, partial [Streptomyces albidoflavus]